MILSNLNLFHNRASPDKDNHRFEASAAVDSSGTLISFALSQATCRKIQQIIIEEAISRVFDISEQELN